MKKIFLSMIFAGSVFFYSCENKQNSNENFDEEAGTEMEDTREYDIEAEQDMTEIDSMDTSHEVEVDTTTTL